MFGTILYLERDDDQGWHCVVHAFIDECVLHITDSYQRAGDAERAAQAWIEKEAARQTACTS